MNKAISMLVLLFSFIGGCKKDVSVTKSTDNDLFTVKNGIVAFKSIDAYRQLLGGGPQVINKFVKDLLTFDNYHPLSMNTALRQHIHTISASANRLVTTGDSLADGDIADIFEDPLFANLVNQDGLVIIGDYMFNIDLIKKKCYALHTSWLSGTDSSYYYNLVFNGISSNDFVFEFSTDDEALEMLEDWGWPVIKNSSQQLARRCGETGVRNFNIDREPHFPFSKEDNREYYYKIRLAYMKLGILFKLHAKYTAHTVGWPLPTTNWGITM